jgi:hypothetical protein
MMLTAADQELLDLLLRLQEMQAGRRPEGWAYSSIHDFLIQHATFFTPCGLPRTLRPMTLQMCFENAYRVARRTTAYHYVEGWAVRHIPVQHAWVVDREGNAYDPTWASGSDLTVGTTYFGVELSLDEVALSRRSGNHAVLDDWKRDYPALQGRDVMAMERWHKGLNEK